MKKSFMLYIDTYEQWDMLTDEQAGILIKALFEYVQTGEKPEISDGMVKIAFSFISAQIDRDNEKYQETCQKRADAGKKGGRPKKQEDISEDEKNNCFSEESKKSKRFFEKAKKPDTDTEKDTDTDTETEKERESSSVPAAPTPSEIVDLFNNICKSYPKVKTVSSSRKKAIKARLRSYGLDVIRTVFEKAENSSFLKGSNNRNWSANFDWILNDSNFAKVLDGNYDDKPKITQNSFQSGNPEEYGDISDIMKMLEG